MCVYVCGSPSSAALMQSFSHNLQHVLCREEDQQQQMDHRDSERRASKEAKVASAADKIAQLSARASPSGCSIS